MKVKLPALGTPLGNNILVRPDLPKSHTDAGISIPEAAQEDPRVGTVIALGVDAALVNPDLLKVGSRVMWLYSIPTTIDIDGEIHLLLDVTDIGLVL